jgi:hypothetical protein
LCKTVLEANFKKHFQLFFAILLVSVISKAYRHFTVYLSGGNKQNQLETSQESMGDAALL